MEIVTRMRSLGFRSIIKGENMSISYLIAFDKKLEKTDYLYTYIFNEGKTVWGQKDKIVFSDDLCPQEQEIAMNIFLCV